MLCEPVSLSKHNEYPARRSAHRIYGITYDRKPHLYRAGLGRSDQTQIMLVMGCLVAVGLMFALRNSPRLNPQFVVAGPYLMPGSSRNSGRVL